MVKYWIKDSYMPDQPVLPVQGRADNASLCATAT
jgi:hypothetical protein